VSAGLDPAEFWKQTPKSFVAVMEGAARRHRRDFELAITGAWHAEAFARQKRLKGLADYIGEKPKRRKQSPEEMFAILSQFQAGGAPIDIREVN
jgi:hypothetical protein